MKHISKAILLISGLTLSIGGLGITALAAAPAGTSKQQVTTASRTFSYTDILASQTSPNDPNTKLVDIAPLPANSEVLSGYIKVNMAFTDSLSQNSYYGNIYLANALNPSLEYLVSGSDLNNTGVSQTNSSSQVLVFSDPENLRLQFQQVSNPGDINNMNAGSLPCM